MTQAAGRSAHVKAAVARICQTCPKKLTPQDLAQGCVHCKPCRRAAEPPKANPDKPQTNGSWWLIGQSRAEQDDWFRRAAAEVPRMSGSPEAKTIGIRGAVDELGWKRRGVGES